MLILHLADADWIQFQLQFWAAIDINYKQSIVHSVVNETHSFQAVRENG